MAGRVKRRPEQLSHFHFHTFTLTLSWAVWSGLVWSIRTVEDGLLYIEYSRTLKAISVRMDWIGLDGVGWDLSQTATTTRAPLAVLTSYCTNTG